MQVTRSDVPGGWGQHISLFCAGRLAKADQMFLTSGSGALTFQLWFSGVSTSEFTDFVLFGRAVSVVNKSLDFV